MSRIGSVKKWGVRRKRGDSTAPTDANGTYDRRRFFLGLIFFYNLESFIEREPISSVSKLDPRRRRRGDSTTPADIILTGRCLVLFFFSTPLFKRFTLSPYGMDTNDRTNDEIVALECWTSCFDSLYIFYPCLFLGIDPSLFHVNSYI